MRTSRDDIPVFEKKMYSWWLVFAGTEKTVEGSVAEFILQLAFTVLLAVLGNYILYDVAVRPFVFWRLAIFTNSSCCMWERSLEIESVGVWIYPVILLIVQFYLVKDIVVMKALKWSDVLFSFRTKII